MARYDDSPDQIKPYDAITPGQIPKGRLGVYDRRGNLRAHVGPGATASTASRFTQHRAMKLGTGPDGKRAWICDKTK